MKKTLDEEPKAYGKEQKLIAPPDTNTLKKTLECIEEYATAALVTELDLLVANVETAAAMEITRQSYYRKGWENAMAIRGLCEPLEEAHAKRILSL